MNRWYAHRDEIFNLDSFKIICKGSDIVDYGTEVYEILLSTDDCNTEDWKMDEHSTLSFDTETERDRAFDKLVELLTETKPTSR